MPPGCAGGTVAFMTTSLARLVPVAALIAALVIPASASAYREARFTATFTASVHNEWNFPKTQMARDCYRTTFYEGHGLEAWNVHSTGVNKVLMTGNGVATQFHFGNWHATGDYESTRNGLKAKGEVNRQRTDTTSFGSGSCGTLQLPMMDPPAQKDCGTRLVNYNVQLAGSGPAVEITPDVLTDENGVREKLGYDNCYLVTPDNQVAGAFPAATGRLMAKGKPVTGWFGKHAVLTAVGHERWEAKEAVGGGDRTAVTTVDWKLTFKRAGKGR
jgi:hypothetical protein